MKGERAEKQEVQQVNVQRKRSLADERLDGLVPPVASAVHRWCCNVLVYDHTTSPELNSTQTRAFMCACTHTLLVIALDVLVPRIAAEAT